MPRVTKAVKEQLWDNMLMAACIADPSLLRFKFAPSAPSDLWKFIHEMVLDSDDEDFIDEDEEESDDSSYSPSDDEEDGDDEVEGDEE